MKVLVAGGAGYIGTHTCLQLLEEGHEVVVVDNLSNSKFEALNRVQKITGKTVKFYQVNVCDKKALSAVFKQENIHAVINFAGYKAVGESVEKPLEYYQNNVSGAIILAQVMREHNVWMLVFSSSATVYGSPASLPIKEDFPLSATNPYGRSKLIIEDILRDLFISDNRWKIGLLRYFNPVGAHISGQIGEDPSDIPNNLMPYISQVAIGKLECLSIFGDDYPTPDGTGVRDYIHVEDLANGHLKTIETLDKTDKGKVLTVNLGTGTGYSVLEMIKAFEKASSHPVKYAIKPRRSGDIAACYADPGYALETIGWKAKYGLKEMCIDTWRWQSNNPNGYDGSTASVTTKEHVNA